MLSSQSRNVRLSRLYAIDHHIDPEVVVGKITGIVCHIERSLPIQDCTLDNITIVNGLEHLWYPQEILNEFFRILKPNGVLQVVVPTWFGKPFLEFLAFRLNNRQASIEMDDHKMYYDEAQLWPLAIKAGFHPRDVELKRIKMFCSLYMRARKSG